MKQTNKPKNPKNTIKQNNNKATTKQQQKFTNKIFDLIKNKS